MTIKNKTFKISTKEIPQKDNSYRGHCHRVDTTFSLFTSSLPVVSLYSFKMSTAKKVKGGTA